MLLNYTKRLWNHCFAPLLALLLVCAIAGCGDQEPQQRSSFIIFLQTEIINKNRLNPPTLTSVQQRQFGVYAKDYQVLTDFYAETRTIFTGPLTTSLQDLQSMKNVQELVNNSQKINLALTEVDNAKTKLASALSKAEQAKAALNYPSDLQAVFDNAYTKVVAQHGELVEHLLPALTQLFHDALNLTNFIQAQGANITLSNNQVEFPEQPMVDKYNQLNTQLQKSVLNVQNLAIQQR